MTKEEFSNLSPLAQEEFINNGGRFTSSVGSLEVKEQVGIGSDVFHGTSGGSIIPPTSLSSMEQKVSFPSPSQPVSDFDDMGFDIKDPVELLFLLDEGIQKGKARGGVDLHEWQIQIMLDFALSIWNDQRPFQAAVRACNGSGKDKFIIAACVVWLCMRYRKALGVITSSSGAQLDNQTCRYIKLLCEAANKRFCIEMWNVKYREYTLDFSIVDPLRAAKSSIFCFATDEPKKAEGYHPTDYGTKMLIAVSEDKSVPDDINVALNKCTGYTHRLHVSTPGLPMGHFYDYCSTAIDRKTIKDINTLSAIDWIQYHITAYDCSHISKFYIEQMKRDLPGGENGAAFKSQVLAEFGTTDEMVVIPYTYIWQSFTRQDIEYFPETYNTGGLDLSDGGDETVLVVRNGNKHLVTIPFKFDNTEDTIAFLKEKFKEWSLNHPEALVFGDYGGLGAPMLKALKRSGWSNIRYIDSRTKAMLPNVYLNRGTELFFHVRQLFERREIILKKDDLLVRQLSTRYYKINNRNIHQLLSKLESRSKGYPSPDRADAFNLCFWNYKSTKIETEEQTKENKPFEEKEEEKKTVGDFNLKNWAEGSQRKWQANGGVKDFSSLESEIEEYNKNKRLMNN